MRYGQTIIGQRLWFRFSACSLRLLRLCWIKADPLQRDNLAIARVACAVLYDMVIRMVHGLMRRCVMMRVHLHKRARALAQMDIQTIP